MVLVSGTFSFMLSNACRTVRLRSSHQPESGPKRSSTLLLGFGGADPPASSAKAVLDNSAVDSGFESLEPGCADRGRCRR